jgi:flagellar export protein FliJ
MGFRFSLKTLLRLREIAEQKEERLLGQILNQMAQARQTLTDLAAQRKSIIAQQEAALRQPIPASAIAGFYWQMLAIDQLERTGREHLAKLAVLREQQMKIYEKAHREHDLLAGIKSDKLEAFRREQTRLEQKAMDDNFSSRRSFR